MEKFNINEFLRYLSLGVFFVFLSYLEIDSSFFEKHAKVLENDSESVILIGLCLLSGTFAYVVYRATWYPLFHWLIVWGTRSRRNSTDATNCELIRQDDEHLWSMSEGGQRKSLYEWASQIHFLYNLSLLCFYVYLMSYLIPKIYSTNCILILIGLILLAVSVFHHCRYKVRQIEIQKKPTENNVPENRTKECCRPCCHTA